MQVITYLHTHIVATLLYNENNREFHAYLHICLLQRLHTSKKLIYLKLNGFCANNS